MNYDAILGELGQFSKWHIFSFSMILCFAFTNAMFDFSFAFLGLEPSTLRCRVDECDQPDSTVMQYGEDLFEKDSQGQINFCKTYPYKNLTGQTSCTIDDFDLEALPIECLPEDKIIYGPFGMDNTVTTEFNLVCQDQYKVALTTSITMFGIIISSPVFGYLGDKIGRKATIIIATILTAASGLTGAFMPSYLSFTITRLISSIGGFGFYVVPFSLAVEITGPAYSTLIATSYQIVYALGEASVGILALVVKEWRLLQIIMSTLFCVCLVCCYFLPESPRWLIATGRFEQAQKQILKAAKFNKVTLSSELLAQGVENDLQGSTVMDNKAGSQLNLEAETNTDEKHASILDILKHPLARRNLLVMSFNWMAVNVGYYGIGYGATTLSDNVHLDFILASLIEIPSVILVLLLMDRVGRKPLLSGSMLLCGIMCIPAGYVTTGLKTTMVLIGKFSAAAAFAVIYLYTVEMCPTEVRSSFIGVCSMVAKLGGIVAPQITLFLPSVTFDELPFIVMGAIAVTGGLLSLLLPETLGFTLLDSFEDIDRLEKNPKRFFSWWSKAILEEQLRSNNQGKS